MPTTDINDLPTTESFTASPGQTVFSFDFRLFDFDYLTVMVDGVTATYDPTPTTATEYSITSDPDTEGGSITFGLGLTSGDNVVLDRQVPRERLSRFPATGPFSSESLNREFDRYLAIIQDLGTAYDRTIRLPVGESGFVFPTIAERSEGVLGFDTDGSVLIYPIEDFRGPTGDTGPSGTLGANSGFTTTVSPEHGVAGAAGITILGGGGGTGRDVLVKIQGTSGTLAALDIYSAGTGHNLRFFRADGLLESYVSDGNAWITAKWIGIYAGLYTDSLTPGAAGYQRVYHPPNILPHMLGIHADVHTAICIRGSNTTEQHAILFQNHDGFARRLDRANGQIRFARPDAPYFIGDQFNSPLSDAAFTDPVTGWNLGFPISLEPHNVAGLFGIRLRSYDTATIGEVGLYLGTNGFIAGSTSGRLGLHHESGSQWNLGNATDGTIIRGAQLDFDSIPKLKTYTAAELLAATPSAVAHPRGLVYVSNGTGNKRLAISDGAAWRFPDGAVVS